MKSWIHLVKGQTPRQARVGIGELKEDLLGRQGFFGRAVELYHLHDPTAWTRIEGNLRPWDIDGYQLKPHDPHDPRGEALTVFYNTDVSMAISRRRTAMPYYRRNADGDEIYFIHKGTGTCETEFGPIAYEPGDYTVLPRGVTYRIVPEGQDTFFMVIESVGEVEFPDYCIFQSRGFVVCNLLPRPAEGEPDVERLPQYHRNIDYDEVILVRAGTMFGVEVPPGTFESQPKTSRRQRSIHVYITQRLWEESPCPISRR